MARSLGDLLFHFILMAAASWFLMKAYALPASAAGGSLPPDFFPKAVLVSILFLLSISLLQGIVKSSRSKAKHGRTAWAKPFAAWCCIVVLLAAYAAVIEQLGYIISTTLFLYACISCVGMLARPLNEVATMRNSLTLALFVVAVSTAIYLIFTLGFEILLPSLGVLGV